MTSEKTDGANSEFSANLEMAGQSQTAGYEIRVKDHLETYWFEWFEGWTVTNLEQGEVLLKSCKVDQSKLHGALNKVRDLNLTLLSVTCVPARV